MLCSNLKSPLRFEACLRVCIFVLKNLVELKKYSSVRLLEIMIDVTVRFLSTFGHIFGENQLCKFQHVFFVHFLLYLLDQLLGNMS